MEEGKRQKQVSKLILQELSDIFQREGLNVIGNGMISISKVKMTPDLLEARVYLSLFQIEDKDLILQKIKERSHELKRQLAERLKHQLRRIPDIQYFLDDTLDYVFKMEELFKQIHQKKDEPDTP